MKTELLDICKQFQLDGTVKDVIPLEEGFINDTYYVYMEGEPEPGYILQRKNSYVFRDVPAMMDNIDRVTRHLKIKIKAFGGDPLRETLTLKNTSKGNSFLKDSEGEYWTICLFIKGSRNFQKVNSPELAFSGGKAIGMFQSLLSDFQEPLADILPGFHNISYRFKQWDEALNNNFSGRKNMLTGEIDRIESRREEMTSFYSLVETGKIPPRVAHNDTKISNVLFDKSGEVLCLIDLDTVMLSSVLYDFGDALRTYANTGEEDDNKLENVRFHLGYFEAFARGYMEQSKNFLTRAELEYLAFSVKYITYEQVLRFLMDYIDGDKYYKIKSPDHNLVRAHAQFKLLESIESQIGLMEKTIMKLV